MNFINKSALLSTTLLTFLISMSASAAWSGGIEGGQVLQGDQKGTRLRLNLSNNERPLTHRFYADWVRGDADSNSYEAGYEPQYWFTDTTYAFGEGSVRTAKSQQVDQQIKVLAGLGIQLLNTETTQLYGEVGVGQLTTKFDEPFLGEELSVDTTFSIARAGVTQTVIELIKLELEGDYSVSEDTETLTAEAGVSYMISGGAIKYSYRVQSHTIGDQNAVNITGSSVSFNYNF